LHLSLADGAFYLGIHAHNQPVKIIATFLTIILIEWNCMFNVYLNLPKDKIAFP
jgi:hypothetical protein